MKQLTTYLLLGVLLMQPFHRIGILLSFAYNQPYIAAALCENRDRPETGCNGHCVLTKQMKQADEQEKPVPTDLKVKEVLLFFQALHLGENNTGSWLIPTKHCGFYIFSKPFFFIGNVFRPPISIF